MKQTIKKILSGAFALVLSAGLFWQTGFSASAEESNLIISGNFLRDEENSSLLIGRDAVNFCDAVCSEMGEDFIVGTAICNSDLADANEMALVTKHFNALTLGNELKPDAMFGYSNDRCPGTETVILNGEEILVPKMDYSRAEKTLNYIYDWNEKHPEKIIKIRGHVLVWHSQTPEWWFHEDYDKSKPFADVETMNKRLEWYIKTMAEHFTGKQSKYRGMFYGWDVVNEAVSDGGARYRNDSENSKWWKVYQSNEFIINAFRYANQYMDPSVELYYNDYNECGEGKRAGIVQLLKDVKEAEGTRIDGVGMQGHYQTASTPSVAEFAASARAFSQVVDKIQVTEFDLGSTGAYDGTDLTKEAEFSTQAYRYKEFYDTIRKLKSEGVNFTNITFWGVVDKYSWLQTANSAGGGSDGKRKQCPLLFDDNYQIKPAFWAFADAGKLKPVPKQIRILQAGSGGSMQGAEEINFSSGETSVTFKTVWNDGYLLFKITVQDKEASEGEGIRFYVTKDQKTIQQKEILRTEAVELFQKGYETTVRFDFDNDKLKVQDEVFFDIVVINNGEACAYSDQNLTQETTAEYYAKALLTENPALKENPSDKKESETKTESKLETESEIKSETKQEAIEDNVQSDEEKSSNASDDGHTPVFLIIGAVVLVFLAGLFFLIWKKRTETIVKPGEKK